MTAPIRCQYLPSCNLYAFIWNFTTAKIAYAAGEVFESYGNSGRDASDYAVTLPEVAVGYYKSDGWPAWIPEGNYDIVIRLRAGATPSDSDSPIMGPVEKTVGAAIAPEEEVGSLDLYNSAIGRLGGGVDELLIESLEDEDSDSLYWCNIYYPEARKQVLMSFDCIEAMKYAALETEVEDIEKADWLYAYSLPADCLRFKSQVYETDRSEECECEIVNGTLLTNELTDSDGEFPYIKYIFNLQDVNALGQFLREAIEVLLASMIAVPLGRGWDVRDRLKLEYIQISIVNAKRNNQKQVYSEYRNKGVDWIIDSVR